MTYTPSIPMGGYAGWAYLKRTLAGQTVAFNASPDLTSDKNYFRAHISAVNSADDLVNDRRLLKVALGAFGLEADINSKFFIKKVLQDGTLQTGALANKLADKQYLKFSAAFGFGDFSVPRNKISTFADKIISAFEARQFEAAVGGQNSDFRFALNVERELPDIAVRTSSENTKWLTVLGSAPLRQVFEKAFGIPASIGRLDLDRQLDVFKSKADSQLGSGSIGQFSDPTKIEKLNRLFLLRSEAESYAQSSGNNVALQMMQQIATNARYRFGADLRSRG